MKKILYILLLVCSQSFATNYYISPTGSDVSGNGTIANPYFTLTKAWSYVSTGDTIYARGGTYRVTARPEMMFKSGTANARISVLNYPGEHPIITPNDTAQYYGTGATIGVIMRGCHYITFKGFEITGFEMPPYLPGNLVHGFMVDDSRFCIFENLSIHGNGNGLRCEGISGQNRFINCDFYDNNDPYTAGDPYGNSDGLQIAFIEGIAQSDTSWVIGCRAWLNSDDGFDYFSNQGVVIMDNCWSFRNGYKTWNEQIVGNGNGVKLGPTAYTSSIKRKVTRVIAAGNRTNGIESNQGFGKHYVANCMAYQNGLTALGAPHWPTGFKFSDNQNLVQLYNEFYNNISMNNGNYEFNGATAGYQTNWVLQNNTFTLPYNNNGTYPGHAVYSSDFVSLDITQLYAARNFDNSLPNITCFQLTAGSSLIDAGTNVGLPYNGLAMDIGVFEYTPPLPIKPRIQKLNGKIQVYKGKIQKL